MNPTADYAAEKLWAAVHSLAVGADSLPDRLYDAYVEARGFKHTWPGMPEELKARMAELQHRVTCESPDGDEGAVKATLAKMTVSEAVECAQEILTLAYLVKKTGE